MKINYKKIISLCYCVNDDKDDNKTRLIKLFFLNGCYKNENLGSNPGFVTMDSRTQGCGRGFGWSIILDILRFDVKKSRGCKTERKQIKCRICFLFKESRYNFISWVGWWK